MGKTKMNSSLLILVVIMITFGSCVFGAKELEVSYFYRVVNGGVLPLTLTARPPRILIEDNQNSSRTSSLFSILMLDRGASRVSSPSRTTTYVHMWIANIDSQATDPYAGGRVLEGYVPPSPHDNNLHTYEFILVPQSFQIYLPLRDRFVDNIDRVLRTYGLGYAVSRVSFRARR